MKEAVLKVLKKIGLFATRPANPNIHLVRETGKHVPVNRYVLSIFSDKYLSNIYGQIVDCFYLFVPV